MPFEDGDDRLSRNVGCVTSQKSEDLIYTVAEVTQILSFFWDPVVHYHPATSHLNHFTVHYTLVVGDVLLS